MAKKKTQLTEEFLSSYAQDQFRRSQNWRAEKIDERWRKNNELYNSQFPRKEKEKSDVLLGQGRLFIPKTYSHVQRMLVDILDTVFFDPEEIVDIGSWKNVPRETKDIVKSVLNYRLNGHPIHFYQEAYEACLNALKNKVGIFKVYPKLKAEKATDELGQESTRITSYAPIIENLPYEDVFFDPQATWKDYWKFPIVHRMVRSLDYLKRRGYKNLDRIQPMGDHIGGDLIKQQRTDYASSPFWDNSSVKVQNLRNVYVYEVWTFLDVNGDGFLESCSYLMAGEAGGPKVLIRDVEENTLPFKHDGDDYNRPPLLLGSAFPEAHELYGKSVPEVVEGLQRETNAIRNQRREAVALALRRPLLVARSSNIDLMALVNRKIGGIVLGDDVSPMSVRELELKDPTGSSVQEEERNDQNFYEATSLPPNLMGMPSSPDETATAVTSHTANANKKIAQIIKNLVQTLFIPAFEMLLRLEQEYESDDFVALVTARKLGWGFAMDGLPPRQIIQGDFELTANIGMNKQLQLNKWMMLIDRGNIVNQATGQMVATGVINPQKAHFVDTMKMFHKVLPLLGEKNIEEFMIQAQQPPVEMQNGGKGVPSQPALTGDMPSTMSNMNPEPMSGYAGIM